MAGFKKLKLNGALGKRTQFQVKSLPQLFVEFEINSNNNSFEELPTEIIQNKKNEDDTLLDKIIFDEKIVENERLNSHQTACILISALLEINENKFEQQGNEKTMIFLEEVINQSPCWSLQMRALIERSKLEINNSRKIERACSQMEILAKIVNETVVKNESIKKERLNLIFTSSPLPFWKINKLHAEILFSLGCFSNAIKIFEKLNLWENVVNCYLNCGQTEKAEFIIKRLLKEKEDSFYYCLLGNITNKEFYYFKAIEVSNDENSLARTSLGNLFLKRKNFSEAIKHFKRSLDIQPLQSGVYFNYGYSAMKIGDFETSVKAFHRCVSIEPEHFEAWNNLAACYIQLNQKHRAHKILQEALKLSWENTFLWTNYLLICVDIGDFKNAISSFDKLMDLDKNLKIDELPLEIICFEILNNSEENIILELKNLIIKVLGRVSTRQSLNGKLQRFYALLKKPENEDNCTQYLNFIFLLEKSFKKEFDRITLEKLNKNYKDLLNQFLELIAEFKILWKIQNLQKIEINSQLKLRINPIIKFFEKEFDENCKRSEDEEFKQLIKNIKNLIN